jgi:8-oxo-dGTP pyrophosphatase MutT (NUDIX family)
LERALGRHRPHRVQGHQRAAVAAILRDHDGAIELLLVERARRAGDRWSGHWAFPGGVRQADDSSDVAAAVRETREEVDLDLDRDARRVGALSDRVTLTHRGRGLLVVTPFVFVLERHVGLRPGAEIRDCRWLPLAALAEQRRRRTRVLRALGWVTPRLGHPMDRRPLWGLTLRMVDELVDCASCA